jgi:hypothetical protein
VTPDQALELMNGSSAHTFAKALAARIANDQGQNAEDLAERSYRLALGRPATTVERERAKQFLAGPGKLEDLALALLSSSEFLYID